jgi:hypothetical protein
MDMLKAWVKLGSRRNEAWKAAVSTPWGTQTHWLPLPSAPKVAFMTATLGSKYDLRASALSMVSMARLPGSQVQGTRLAAFFQRQLMAWENYAETIRVFPMQRKSSRGVGIEPGPDEFPLKGWPTGWHHISTNNGWKWCGFTFEKFHLSPKKVNSTLVYVVSC